VTGKARPIAELVAELEAGRFTVDPDLRLVRGARARGAST
jgi:hypothetical protein